MSLMIPVAAATDQKTLRMAYSGWPSGVTAVCAAVDGELVGMAASSFTSVSLHPPLVSVCVVTGSRTWAKLQRAGRIGVSVLGTDQAAIARAMGTRDGDRFAGAETMTTEEGAVLVRGAPAWYECSITQTMPGGDHLIVLLTVHSFDVEPDRDPLIFHAAHFRGLSKKVMG